MRFIVLMIILAGLLAGCQQSAKSVIAYEHLYQTGDAERGAQLFSQSINSAPPCSGCHLMDQSTASPNLTGYGEVAGTRVAGEDAREYTFYSIAEPGRFIVQGYGNAMYNQYDNKLTPDDIADLIAYVLSL